ncbi:hypothetical protein [Streptomyces fulvoviolaceus]|nr:hypothetical protein [Streptomyces fulvoviolaceus]MCT9075140.1 hypothetical protein [Streptomyces fulvoviolaceus]
MGGAISEDVTEDAMAFSREGAARLGEAVNMWDEPDHDRRLTPARPGPHL